MYILMLLFLNIKKKYFRTTTIQKLSCFWIKLCVTNLLLLWTSSTRVFYVVFLPESLIDFLLELKSNRTPQKNVMQMKKKLFRFETYTFHFLLRQTFLSWKVGRFPRIVCDISYDKIFSSHPWLSGFRNMNLWDYV